MTVPGGGDAATSIIWDVSGSHKGQGRGNGNNRDIIEDMNVVSNMSKVLDVARSAIAGEAKVEAHAE